MTEPARSQTVLAYWLSPAPPAREFLRETIGSLAAQYDAPLFEPHLTLAIGPDSIAEAHRVLAGLTSGPIELHAAGIHFAAKFTRTLFIRFNSSPALERLRNSLGMERVADQPFDPHASLLYKTMPIEKQAQLAAAMKLPFQSVTFNGMQAVRCRLPVATSTDVAAWEIVASRRLGN